MGHQRVYSVRREMARVLSDLLEGEARREELVADEYATLAEVIERSGSLSKAKQLREASRGIG